ncbi:MAG: TatD family hydrolase, partial [Nanoarchaeota archaeon]
MRIVDVHAHLDMEPLFQDIEGVISRSVSAGVKVIIANGTNPESNRRVMALSRRYDVVKPALGIYPTETIDYSEEKLDEEIAFIRLKRPFAIGEVGLDYKYADAHDKRGFKEISEQEQQRIKTLQQNAFVKFIKLANELDIPLIVHSRKA